MTSKPRVAVDEKDRLLKLLVSGGNRNDICEAPLLLDGCYILADKGYDSADFVERIEGASGIAVIPSRTTNKVQRGYDKEAYKRRNQVARFFNRMKQYRRFATRYEEPTKSFISLAHFVAVFISLAISRLLGQPLRVLRIVVPSDEFRTTVIAYGHCGTGNDASYGTIKIGSAKWNTETKYIDTTSYDLYLFLPSQHPGGV